ncbi:MAG: ABC-2 family transporter protein [Pseudomonadota bacterium]|nr:MAG: multidrug ABC transporter permease [Pseudomonadota bacterium]
MSPAAAFLRKLRAFASTGVALFSEYRAELFLWSLAGVIPLIMMGVWRQASATGAFPLDPTEFTRYFLAVFLVRQATIVWVIWDFEAHVVSGTLSPLLLQPSNPAFRFVVWHLTERLARAPFALAVLAIWLLLFPDAFFWPKLGDVCLAVLGIAASFATRFVIQYAFAMVGFWSERATSLEEVWFLVYVFLSGVIAPLDVYPDVVRTIAAFTPFPYFVYFPVQLLLGREENVLRGFVVLAVWWGLGYALYRVLWRKGLRHYSAMGA